MAATTKRDDSLCEAESKTNAKRFLNVCLAGEGREEAKLFFFLAFVYVQTTKWKNCDTMSSVARIISSDLSRRII